MKFYISQETKQELEAKIKELNKTYYEYANWEGKLRELSVYKEILKSSIVLPVEESWEKYVHPVLVPFFEKDLPYGIIIQPKQ
jgi:hypothetical protein